eukprot:gene7032-19743_t
MDLVSIETEQEMQLIKSLIAINLGMNVDNDDFCGVGAGVWTGCHLDAQDQWSWDGTGEACGDSASSESWNSLRSDSGEHCVHLWFCSQEWATHFCSGEEQGYICEDNDVPMPPRPHKQPPLPPSPSPTTSTTVHADVLYPLAQGRLPGTTAPWFSSGGGQSGTGEGQHISIDSSSRGGIKGMLVGGRALSICAWVKYESFGDHARVVDFGLGNDFNIIIDNSYDSSNSLMWHITGERSAAAAGSDTNWVHVANFWELGSWVHMCASIDATGEMRVFKNGVAVDCSKTPEGRLGACDESTGTGLNGDLPPRIRRTNSYIGRSNWRGDDYFHGAISDISVMDGVAVTTSQEATKIMITACTIPSSLVGTVWESVDAGDAEPGFLSDFYENYETISIFGPHAGNGQWALTAANAASSSQHGMDLELVCTPVAGNQYGFRGGYTVSLRQSGVHDHYLRPILNDENALQVEYSGPEGARRWLLRKVGTCFNTVLLVTVEHEYFFVFYDRVAGNWATELLYQQSCDGNGAAGSTKTFRGVGISDLQCRQICEGDGSCNGIFGNSVQGNADLSCWTCAAEPSCMLHAVVVSINTKADYEAALASPEFPFKEVASVSITWNEISTEELEKLFVGLTSVTGELSIEACANITSIIIPSILLAGGVSVKGCPAARLVEMNNLGQVTGDISVSSVNLDTLGFDALIKIGGRFHISEAVVKVLEVNALEECGSFRFGNNAQGLASFHLPKLKKTSRIHFGVHSEQLQQIFLPALEHIDWLEVDWCKRVTGIEAQALRSLGTLRLHNTDSLKTLYFPQLERWTKFVLYGAHQLKDLCGAPNLKGGMQLSYPGYHKDQRVNYYPAAVLPLAIDYIATAWGGTGEIFQPFYANHLLNDWRSGSYAEEFFTAISGGVTFQHPENGGYFVAAVPYTAGTCTKTLARLNAVVEMLDTHDDRSLPLPLLQCNSDGWLYFEREGSTTMAEMAKDCADGVAILNTASQYQYDTNLTWLVRKLDSITATLPSASTTAVDTVPNVSVPGLDGGDDGDGGSPADGGTADGNDPPPTVPPLTSASSSSGAAAGIVIGLLALISAVVVGVLHWHRNGNACSQPGAAATADRNELARRETVRNTMEMEMNPLRQRQQQQEEGEEPANSADAEQPEPQLQAYAEPGGNQMLYSANSAASAYRTPSGNGVVYAVPMETGADLTTCQANDDAYYSQISELPAPEEDRNGYVDDGWVQWTSGSTNIIYAIPTTESTAVDSADADADTYETVA